MHFSKPSLASACLLPLAACTTTAIVGDPAVPVYAVAETEPVGTANEDAADDPAIWRNPVDGADSLIVGTDKKGGLYVYGLDGSEKSFLAAPGLNNVDLVTMADGTVIVAASDRSELATAHILLATLDTGSGRLAVIDRIPVGAGEGYGICMAEPAGDGAFAAFSAPKNGVIYRTDLRIEDGRVGHTSEAIGSVPSQPEGCAYDDRNDTLYIGEELGGIWRFSGNGDGEGTLMARVDNRNLVADLEGLALVPEGADGGYLYASSQGDNTFMRYALPGVTPAGRFRIATGAFGAAEETDGIEVERGDFGPAFPGGLFIAQDGINQDRAQNFKLVPLAAIEAALGD